MEIRKVPASAGAQWLLETFGLLRKSPFGFGALGLLYAALWLGTALLAQAMPSALAVPLQLVSFIVGALLVALMIHAAREVDAGRSASLGALLASVQGGAGARMLRTLVPQAIFAVAMAALVVVLIGPENLIKFTEAMAELQAKANSGTRVDPQTLMQGPIVRVAVGALVVMGVSVLVFMFTMTVLPDMLLEDRRLGPALRRGVAAGARNLFAVIVYLVLAFVILMAVSIAFGIVLGALQLVFGQAVAIAGNALLYGLFMCGLAGSMYFAWKHMLGGAAGDTATAAPPASGVAM